MKEKVFLIIMVVLCASCARIVTPKGGQRDVLPPKYLSSKPKNNQTNFKGKEIEVSFDEYIVLDNVNEKLIVSTPLKNKPNVSSHLKKLYIKDLDSLQDNTTYIFDFSDAIIDYNEGNSLSHYSFAFSTGNTIDTMVYKGKLIDSYSLKPAMGQYVTLYQNIDKKYQTTHLPNYITRTDSNGNFVFKNIKEGKYQLIAFEDKNQNQYYDLITEGIGFSDTLISPYNDRKDTSLTINTRKRIDTFYFSQAKDTTFQINSSKLVNNRELVVAFSQPISDSFQITFNQPKINDKDLIVQMNENKDTIHYYSIGNLTFDTLLAEIRSEEHFKEKIELYYDNGRKKHKQKDEHFYILANKTIVPYYENIILTLPFSIDTNKNLPLKAKIVNKKDTSVVDFVAIKGKMNIIQSKDKLNEGEDYTIIIDSNSVEYYSGKKNNKFSQQFHITTKDDYGKLVMTIKDSVENNSLLIFSLFDDKDNKILEDKYMKGKEGVVVFENLNEGNYKLRVIIDSNGNKKWDSNDFFNHTQADKIEFFSKMIMIRKGWDTEEEWKVLS